MKSIEYRKSSAQLCALAMFAFYVIAVTGCGQDAKGSLNKSQKSESSQVGVNNAAPTIRANLPKDLLPWLIDVLELKKHQFENYQITKYDISPDNRYLAINISNGKAPDSAGPFYRFVVVDAHNRQILFPSKDIQLSDDLGYPYVAAKFSDQNLVAVAYGMRNIIASVVSLPGGEVIKRHELEVSTLEGINAELSVLLDGSSERPTIGGKPLRACGSLKESMKSVVKEIQDYHSMAFRDEPVVENEYKVLPSGFKLNGDSIRDSDCIEDIGIDECSGDMKTISYFADHTYRDYAVGWEEIYAGNFGRLSHHIYQGMNQDELTKALGRPYRRNEFVMSYQTISEFEDESPEEQLFFYFKHGRLFAIKNGNGSGC